MTTRLWRPIRSVVDSFVCDCHPYVRQRNPLYYIAAMVPLHYILIPLLNDTPVGLCLRIYPGSSHGLRSKRYERLG